ncbi:hypothetical protein DFP72DRAFT_420556 [Ephemerocybe angulata]|uniref:Uncharacterized protein n=1 Tax=Ephemerocybe angulata TaxID=980116 RepID=A0A8H6IH81_9AGAR|nr:hypothetical protein DFP72DRAFT_420556 [Tulosesus angulatus]
MSDVVRIAEPIAALGFSSEKVHVEVSVGSLYPVLPQHTGRYNVAKRVNRSHAVVGAGMFMSARTPVPMYLPQQWSAHTHPEGQVYFVRSGPIRVVTDSYLYKSEVSDKIVSWVQIIEKEAASKGFSLTETVELYVQLEDEDCNYYFADHAARTLFWLDDYDTSELGLLPVVSPSHLKLQLEEHYWTHVEYHCMHAVSFQNNIVEEAISQLIHACGDQMTSSSSTFPYTFQECKNFLDILVPARQKAVDGHITTLVARIFNVVANNRYWTHYGQEQARLSRDTSIVESADDDCVTWPAAVSSALTFKSSDFFEARLNAIFTDNYVYAIDWQKFMQQSLGKWKNAFVLSLALLVLHVFCFFLPVSQSLAVASSSFLGLSIFLSAVLVHQHQDLENGTAGEAYAYLSKNISKKYKFQALSLLFSLPQAFSLWGLVLTFSQALLFIQPFHLYILFSTAVLASVLYVSRSLFSRRAPPPAPEKESATQSLA